ncbi:winged helix-turn-helix transcriptional regulator [Natrinema halophilum]|uniref:winged helix-turn-helix transcriptional regulator n=1 Tax=Natrinema halophilum TaxID=1699371 RepID=UPI001F37A690|nr:winged helix-turn-helix transcriptional regulator [Natrinema halophilum]UHQ96240.1 winged helix-turn-helix transcriptional regulator [Natrinema halophilum]
MTRREVTVPSQYKQAIEAVSVVSKKWHPVVLAVLFHDGPQGFNDLLQTNSNLSGKVLSETLEDLREAGLVERRELSETALRVEYHLTNAGRDFEPIFDALSDWGERHLETEKPGVLVADTDHRIIDLYSQWLRTRYRIVSARGTDEVRSRLDEPIDIVLLDENLPGTNVETFVSELDHDCRTILLVNDRPSFDLISVSVDQLLHKPIVHEELIDTVDEQLSRRGESAEQRTVSSLKAKRALFESVYSTQRLRNDDRYRDLCDELENRLERDTQ